MTSALRVLPGAGSRTPESRELFVVLACHELVFALPARSVERLVLPEEIMVIVGPPGDEAARRAGWRLVMVGEQRYAGCNLGAQLGLPRVDAACALLRVQHRGMPLPIALETGPCMIVQPLGPGIPLPPPAFRARPGAIAAAFSTQLLKSKVAAPTEVGLRLDLDRLWGEDELDIAADLLADG